MSVEFKNYDHSFLLKGKHAFAPSDEGRKIGATIKKLVERHCVFDGTYYHFRRGAHIAALHYHRERRFFAKIDLENFFYSIGRNRVRRCLKQIGIRQSERFAKWSCVKNPYGHPSYALPYGFIQSPILASLALRLSEVGATIRTLPAQVLRSIYMDDILLSCDDLNALNASFDAVIAAVSLAGFQINPKKLFTPASDIMAFNCDLRRGTTQVRDERVAEFYSVERSAQSKAAFERYCAMVEAGSAGHRGCLTP